MEVLDTVAEPPSRLIALGGDGTVNTAVGWLLKKEYRCPVGIVPAGTGNNLCRGLGVPLEPEAAFRLALSGEKTRELDAIEIRTGDSEADPLYMIQTSAFGFPADIALQYDRLRRHRLFRWLVFPLGPSLYRLLALAGLASQKVREWRGKDLLDVRCSFPGEELRETILAGFVGNEKSLGGGFVPCPKAAFDDGLIDVCFLRARTGASYLKTFRDVIRGTHLSAESTVVYRQTPGPVEIELSMKVPLLVDGDLPVVSDRYTYSLIPRRIELIVG